MSNQYRGLKIAAIVVQVCNTIICTLGSIIAVEIGEPWWVLFFLVLGAFNAMTVAYVKKTL
jgi:hypothetical protein